MTLELNFYSGCQKIAPLYDCFFYNHLCQPSVLRDLFLKSGVMNADRVFLSDEKGDASRK